jgi:hypothetical protein
VSTPTPTRGANYVPVDAKQNYVHGKVIHIIVEEAPDVVTGMFFINDTSAVLLFDYGASHSFISIAYVENHNLPIALLRSQMIVSSLGGDMPCYLIKGVDFVTNLTVLEPKGIDVIHGMDWLSNHKVLIDYTKKFVKLTTPDQKELEFIAEPVVTAKGVANHAKVNQLDAI